MFVAEYTPAAAPWPIEEVYPRDLRLGDVVCIGGNYPWLQITRIVDAGENQPHWEKPLGKRAFVLSPMMRKGQSLSPTTITTYGRCSDARTSDDLAGTGAPLDLCSLVARRRPKV